MSDQPPRLTLEETERIVRDVAALHEVLSSEEVHGLESALIYLARLREMEQQIASILPHRYDGGADVRPGTFPCFYCGGTLDSQQHRDDCIWLRAHRSVKQEPQAS